VSRPVPALPTAAAPRRAPLRLRALALLAVVAAGACSTPDPRGTAQDLVVVIVRHAEKSDEAGPDPGLSEAGHRRAAVLARRLAGEELAAIYATAWRRTRQTVAPAAAAQRLPITLYDAREPAEALAARLRASHRAGVVLLAGHSNTVPGMVAAFCRCAAAEMAETEFDRISTVRIGADGRPRLQIERY